MKRIARLVIGVLALATASFAQGGADRNAPPPPLEPGASQADVDKALIAAPGSQRNQATVIKWKPDYTYDTLRKGTNRLVCYDRSGFPQQAPFSVQCTSLANLDRVAQNLKAEAVGDRKKSEALLAEMEKKGTRIKPEYGSMWWSVAGPSQDQARPHHVMIAVPGATTASTGLPENPRQGGAWIMNPGTLTAHIMVPGQ
ncbi:MAG: hypothetical protein OEW19_03505 [Acidobacteriota bacterium]|nr:hypothetical protein [Acidobacteriota bacterium]